MPDIEPDRDSPDAASAAALGAAQDAAMHRVRELLERDRAGRQAAAAQRPWWPRVLGLLLALGVVGIFTLGLDAFLSVYQRMMDMPTQEPPPAEAPIPVYVVPEEPPPEPGEQQPSAPGKPPG